jgi:hypothetical protein
MSEITNLVCACFKTERGAYIRIQRDGEQPAWYNALALKLRLIRGDKANLLEEEYQKQKAINWEKTLVYLRENKDKFKL